MKRTKLLNLLVVALAFTCVFAGCKKKPGSITPLPGRAGKAPESPGATEPMDLNRKIASETSSGVPQGDQRGHVGWNEDARMFEANIVYFDFDSSTIKPSENSKIEKVADYLKGNASHAVKIEGHCDERGTEEYNRSLGERRALAVREHLVSAGIAPDRIETISYGEDRPVEPGHNEAAWKKNRRGVFVLLTPPT
jgi:peptidoglycan-associated lipoprotein